MAHKKYKSQLGFSRTERETGAAGSKLLGVLLLIMGVFGVLVIVHRLSYYVFEYDPEFSPIDYGKYNILSYFTVQSNIFVCFYLLTCAFAIFGSARAKKIAFNPTVGALVTTYIIVTGAVYCCGIPLGFTPPFKWDTAAHSMASFIQVFHHMIVPPFMVILWFFPFTNRKINHRVLPLFGIYPLVYSLFSIVRGAVSDPAFFAYPFYNPEFVFELFMGEREYNAALGYVLMLPLLIAGIGLFLIVARIVIFINDKRTD